MAGGRVWTLFGGSKKLEASLAWRTVQGKMLENGTESPRPVPAVLSRLLTCT
jgi:hypothetical protein